jgi:PIN domain nuclease of toxin-antitoxin system
VNLLLDTHALVWALAEPERIAEAARREIADSANDVYVSAATAWEIAIKVGLGKLAVAPDLKDWLPDQLSAARFVPLPVSVAHALGVERLPRHHRDPFDRLLIAQAVVEGMTIVTRDRIFDRYSVRLMHC